ncbi:IS110 family transposase, partial [Acidithiobacillus ferrooxidans]|nr:IS110 family transposase [Acidithiobacillus ferrooxidans]
VNFQIKHRNPWIDHLLSRRPHNVVIVAQANKMARTIWALLAKNRQYDPRYQLHAEAAA